MTTTNVNWIRNPHDESRMKDLGIRFTRGKAVLAKWDRERSLLLNARVGDNQHIDNEHADDLSVSMEAGRPMHLPVYLWKEDEKTFTSPSGVHRTAAAIKAGVAEIENAYFIDPDVDPVVLEMFVRIVNTSPDRPLDRASKLANAEYLVNTRGLSIKEAAKQLSVPVGWLAGKLGIRGVKNRLERMGIDADAIQLREKVLEKLKAVCGKNDNNLRAAAQLLADFPRMVAEEDVFLEKLKSCGTESQFQEVVQDERVRRKTEQDEREDAGVKPTIALPIGTKIKRFSATLYNIVVEHVKYVEGLQLTYEEAADVIGKLKACITRLREIEKVHQPDRNGSPKGSRKTTNAR